jgi:hypothetical protein
LQELQSFKMIFHNESIIEQHTKNQSKEIQRSLLFALISTLNSSPLLTVVDLLEIFKITIYLILSVGFDGFGLCKLESLLGLCCSHSLFNIQEFIELGKILWVFTEACNKYGLEILIGSSLSLPFTNDSHTSQIKISSFDSLQLLFGFYLRVLKSLDRKEQHCCCSEIAVFYSSFFQKTVTTFCTHYLLNVSTIFSVCHAVFELEDSSSLSESVTTIRSSNLLSDTSSDHQLKKSLFFSIFQFFESISSNLIHALELSYNSSSSSSLSATISFDIPPPKRCESEILGSDFQPRSISFLRDVEGFLQMSSSFLSTSEIQVVITKVITSLNLLSDIFKKKLLLSSFEPFCFLSFSDSSLSCISVWIRFLLAFFKILLSCQPLFSISRSFALSNLFSWSYDNCSFHIIVQDYLYRLVLSDTCYLPWLISFVSDPSEISRLSYSMSSSSRKISNKAKEGERNIPKLKKMKIKEQSGCLLVYSVMCDCILLV